MSNNKDKLIYVSEARSKLAERSLNTYLKLLNIMEKNSTYIIEISERLVVRFIPRRNGFFLEDKEVQIQIPFCPHEGCVEYSGLGAICRHYESEFGRSRFEDLEPIQRSDKIRTDKELRLESFIPLYAEANAALFPNATIKNDSIAKILDDVARCMQISDRNNPIKHEEMCYEIGRNCYFSEEFGIFVTQMEEHSLSLKIVTLHTQLSVYTCAFAGCNNQAVIPVSINRLCIQHNLCRDPNRWKKCIGFHNSLRIIFNRIAEKVGIKVAETYTWNDWLKCILFIFRTGVTGFCLNSYDDLLVLKISSALQLQFFHRQNFKFNLCIHENCTQKPAYNIVQKNPTRVTTQDTLFCTSHINDTKRFEDYIGAIKDSQSTPIYGPTLNYGCNGYPAFYHCQSGKGALYPTTDTSFPFINENLDAKSSKQQGTKFGGCNIRNFSYFGILSVDEFLKQDIKFDEQIMPQSHISNNTDSVDIESNDEEVMK